MYECMCNVRVHITLGFIYLYVLYVCMDALTEVGTSYMDMKEGMPLCMYVQYVCKDLSEQ